MNYIRKYSGIEVERGVMPESLTIHTEEVDSNDEYPASVTLRHLPTPVPAPEASNDPTKLAIPNGLYRSNLTADTTDALLQNAQATEGTRTEKIMAKYVVGCDGAHSWTRRQIGSVMEGEQTDFVWCVACFRRVFEL